MDSIYLQIFYFLTHLTQFLLIISALAQKDLKGLTGQVLK
jgi:hypothetical protein